MTAKTEAQIARMKAQSFGVEIEMNEITREHAARIAAGFFGTNEYENTDCRHGYLTWSAWDGQGREWKFQRDTSIRGEESKKCELVSPILHYEDMEELQELVRRLRRAGAKSDYTRGCGVHVHVGAEGHTAQSLRTLANLMASHEELLIDSLGISRGRTEQYCRTVNPRFLEAVNKKKPQTMAQLADIWYGAQHCEYNRNAHYNSSRYAQLNLHSVFTKGTVEFRLFQFNKPEGGKANGLHAGELKAYIQLSLALSQHAKELKTASPKKSASENKKFLMRTWLLRMGFIGDEFKTAREILTRNLDGDCAFRFGRPEMVTQTAG